MTNRAANDTAADFIRNKIRQIVKDPETCRKLLPHDHPFGAKRGLLDTGYYATYNRDNVHLVDLREAPPSGGSRPPASAPLSGNSTSTSSSSPPASTP